RPPAHRLHRLCAAHRALTRRDRSRAGEASTESGAHWARLATVVGHVDVAHRRAHRGAGASAHGIDAVYRVWVPLPGALPAIQSRRSRRTPGRGPAVLARRPAPRRITGTLECD